MGVGACKDVKADLRPRIADRIAEVERRTAELVAFTTVLYRALEHLDVLPGRSGRCGPQCAFLTHDGTSPAPVTPVPAAQAEAKAERWRTVPVACSLTGEDIASRAGQWQQLLRGAEREEIDDGVCLAVPADRAGQIAALAAAEQQCCPFFDFRLHLDGTVLHLEVRVPTEGADLLAELFTPAA